MKTTWHWSLKSKILMLKKFNILNYNIKDITNYIKTCDICKKVSFKISQTKNNVIKTDYAMKCGKMILTGRWRTRTMKNVKYFMRLIII